MLVFLTFFLIYFDVQVKDLIEYCLQLYMSQKEIIQALQQNAHIEPSFTELGNFQGAQLFNLRYLPKRFGPFGGGLS